MTSSIFLPRRSRAVPAPSTHLTESTMFVLPEPLGPTIAVTPPSKRISVERAEEQVRPRVSEGAYLGVNPRWHTTGGLDHSSGSPNWRLRRGVVGGGAG